jgi:hypothetical protein
MNRTYSDREKWQNYLHPDNCWYKSMFNGEKHGYFPTLEAAVAFCKEHGYEYVDQT